MVPLRVASVAVNGAGAQTANGLCWPRLKPGQREPSPCRRWTACAAKALKPSLPGIYGLPRELATDALPVLTATDKEHKHLKKVTPPDKAKTWLPLVHNMSTMKKCINGTFHGVSSHYLQEYLDEFCCRLNCRFWELELPLRLLNACLMDR